MLATISISLALAMAPPDATGTIKIEDNIAISSNHRPFMKRLFHKRGRHHHRHGHHHNARGGHRYGKDIDRGQGRAKMKQSKH